MQKRVVCVRKGDKYGAEYVRALGKQVERWIDAEFYCLSDGENSVPTIPCNVDYPGWWSKIELFAPWLSELRPFLYVDLDTLILCRIDDVFERCGDDFWMLRDFNRENGGQSAQMWVTDSAARNIWSAWSEYPLSCWTGMYAGDQDFLETFPFRRFQDEFSGFESYKAHKLKDSPGSARIVHFHGKPKMPDCGGWVREIWDGYTQGD